MMKDDMALVGDYAQSHSEQAFAALVSRHVNLVYSVARRQVRDPHLAEEIAQSVFILLANKADSLGPETILSGWLCRTARHLSAHALRDQRRRRFREQEALTQSTMMNEPEPDPWDQVAPLLDEALSGLGKKEHDALVLRFFDGKELKQVGAAMGLTEDAARMRVNRGIEKLRTFFAQRGATLSAATLAGAIAAHSVQAAPAGLAQTISAVAVAKGAAASTSTLTLIKGALKFMAWTKVKTSIVAGAVVLLLGSTVYVSQRKTETGLQMTGTIDLSSFGKPGTHRNFTAFSQSGKWLIHFPIQTNGIEYEEYAFDGANLYDYTQFRSAGGGRNSSTGIIKTSDIPNMSPSSSVDTLVWLACCSTYYFKEVSGNKMEAFLYVNRPPPELEGPFMEVTWQRAKEPPFFPAYIFHPKLNERYQVLAFANFEGLSLPSDFVLEYFGTKGDTNGTPIIAMHGRLTKVSRLGGNRNFRPKIDGRTYTADFRFPGQHSGNYMNQGNDWLSTNSVKWQRLLKLYDAVSGGLTWPRNYTDAEIEP